MAYQTSLNERNRPPLVTLGMQLEAISMRKLIIAAGFVSLATLGGASVSLAQGYYGEPAPYGSSLDYSPGIYDLTPGYHSSPYAYDYYDYDGPYHQRGGPGPRVGNGTGMGIGSQR
jgi:hypothetical protein